MQPCKSVSKLSVCLSLSLKKRYFMLPEEGKLCKRIFCPLRFFSVSSSAAKYFSTVLVGCMSTRHKPESFRRGKLNWENASARFACGTSCGMSSWLMTDVRGPSSLWVMPPLSWWSLCYKEAAGQASHEEQSTQALLHGLSIYFCLQDPALSFWPDFVFWWTGKCKMK